MSFPAYAAYKDSGVDWLGELPEHWQALALSRVLATPVTDGPHTTPEFLDDGVPFLSVDGIQDGKLFFDGCRYVSLEDHKEFSKKAAPKYNDLLMGKAASIGKIARVTENIEFSIWSPLALIRVNEEQCSPEFLEFCLKSSELQHQVLLASNSNTQLNIGMKDIPKLKIPLPAVQEQTQIARFLDHETARIDALIEEQQRLIELLNQKRQALISRAVTRGLEPMVPMKKSGVEWLGEVPAHWDVKALRYLGECQNGINIGGEAFGSGSPFVSYGDVHKNDVLPTEVTGLVQSSPEDRQRYSIEYGDVFFTRTSETVDEIGFSATCLQKLKNAVFAGFLIRFRPTGNSLTPGFSKYYFRNQRLRIFFNKEMNLVTRASLSQDLLKQLPVTLPPVIEQIKISDFLDKVTAEFASLLEQGRLSIDLLIERRSALISAAVTGKIDVRGWQPSARVPSPELELEAV